MRTLSRAAIEVVLSLSLATAACGGSSAPPATPSNAPAAAAPSEAPAAKSSETAAAAEPAAKESPAPAAKPSAAAAARSNREPREIIELKDTVFFFAFDESDPKKAAEANCAKQGSDPKKSAACMSKARAELEGEGYRFQQDGGGNWWWYVVKRKGNVLTNLHKVRYQYGEETDTSVVIKPEGKDEGTARWAKVPTEVKIEVPSEYRIVVQDPKFGKMVYEAKAILGN